MADLLEDPDGAPYPEEVQELVDYLETALGEDLGEVELRAEMEAIRERIVAALESVAKANLERLD